MPATTAARPPILQSKLVLAVSALLLGSLMSPVLGRALRPLFRRAVKGGIVAQRALVGVMSGLREDVEDIVAEAKTELGEEEQDGEAHAHSHGGVPQHAHGSA